MGEERGGGTPAAGTAEGAGARRIGVFCVGNKLMLDDGLGTAVYEELVERYEAPGNVELFDVGCLSMDMLPYVRDWTRWTARTRSRAPCSASSPMPWRATPAPRRRCTT